MAVSPGLADKMRLDDPASELSSSAFSSPPVSPQNKSTNSGVGVGVGQSDTIRVAQPNPSNLRGGVAAPAATSPQHRPATATSNTTPQPQPDKVKRQRKKKDPASDKKAVDDGKPKEKKPRKPRESKDKSAINASSTAASQRKKVKVEEKAAPGASSSAAPTAPVHSPAVVVATPRQATITEMVNNRHSPHHSPINLNAPPVPTDTAVRNSSIPPPPSTYSSSMSRPISSGQKYDPIREFAAPRLSQPQDTFASTRTSPQHTNRASASPSIASLIDPPTAVAIPPPPALTRSPQANTHESPFRSTSQHASTAFNHASLPAQPSPSLPATKAVSVIDGAMDIDQISNASKTQPKDKLADTIPLSKSSSSAAPTPKPAQVRSSPPAPKGTGRGLLSSSDLFGGPASGDSLDRPGYNIDIRIALNPKGGNHVNIAQEIIKRYGRDAINPRAAAHRERLLQVRAAANNIEGTSTDDMSVDLMSDNDGDSNVEMTGVDDDKTPAQDTDKPRKRRKKTEEYDLDDEFIDDTELAWQQQAAVAKDGFFVYSGPLVREGENAKIESSGTSTRGGRGRGRGRGRGASAAGTTHASLAEKKDPISASTTSTTTTTTTTTTGRGRGRGRGTGAPRKPRITKADRERMEAEKAGRERTAASITSSSTPASLPIATNTAPPAFPAPQQNVGTTA